MVYSYSLYRSKITVHICSNTFVLSIKCVKRLKEESSFVISPNVKHLYCALNFIDEFRLLLTLPLLVSQLYGQLLSGAPASHSGPWAVTPEAEVRSASPQTLLTLGDGDQHLNKVVLTRAGQY